MYREKFLTELRSSGVQKYKRYSGSPLFYIGSKCQGVGDILEIMPSDKPVSVMSPFMGGGCVEIAIAKELKIPVFGYDVFDLLVNYWQQQLRNKSNLFNYMRTLIPDRQHALEIREKLRQYYERETNVLYTPAILAGMYSYHTNTAFGTYFLNTPSNRSLNQKNYDRILERVEKFECEMLSVDKMSFEQSIPKHPDSLIYADPPYYIDGVTVKAGLYPNGAKPVNHVGFDHVKLRDLLMTHPGGFILSYNDTPYIRDLYAGCKMMTPKWKYNLGQSNRTGHTRKNSTELLIVKHAQAPIFNPDRYLKHTPRQAVA